jgi:hypothetical protein
MPDDTQSSQLSTNAPSKVVSQSSATTLELAKIAFEKLGESGIGTLTKGLESTTKAAEKGVIPYLLGAGVLLAFYGLTLKVEVSGRPISNLSTGEFVTVFVVAGILIVGGAALRAWTYTSEHALRRDELQTRLKVLEAAAGVAERGMEASANIAQANADIAKAQLGSTTIAIEEALKAAHNESERGQKDPGTI